MINPGDVIVADDDGVCVVPQKTAGTVIESSKAREEKEARNRARFLAGEVGLDVYGMREKLAARG